MPKGITKALKAAELQSWHDVSPIELCVVLYVEDNDLNAYLFQMALRNNVQAPQLFRVADGAEAFAFLLQADGYSDAPRPDLVVLDLHLPRKSGFDLLSEMKATSRLRDIPVIVFSSSMLRQDRERALEHGSNDYLRKDGNFGSFLAVTKLVCEKMAVAQGRMEH